MSSKLVKIVFTIFSGIVSKKAGQIISLFRLGGILWDFLQKYAHPGGFILKIRGQDESFGVVVNRKLPTDGPLVRRHHHYAVGVGYIDDA